MSDSYGGRSFSQGQSYAASWTRILEPIDFPGNGRDYRDSGVIVGVITQTGHFVGSAATLNTAMTHLYNLMDGEEHELICNRWPTGLDVVLADIRFGTRIGTAQYFTLTYYRISKT